MTNTLNNLQGELLLDEALHHYTTWKVGGKAKQLYKPKNVEDLSVFLQQLPKDEPLVWLGLGSNTLIRDGGFKGTVIITQGGLKSLTLDGDLVRAEAGLSCAQVARFCAREGLAQAEFLAGIPGTIGGALTMNAGCFGSETWSYVQAVETMDKQGQLHRRTREEFQIAYREVKKPQGEWFVAGYFKFPQGDKEAALERIKNLLAQRAATQPTGAACCGSTFRNPPKDFSGRLIEVSGLKGYQIGGAKVSEKHANFIVNEGSASAKDIEALMHYVKDKVFELQGVELIPEVHIIGD